MEKRSWTIYIFRFCCYFGVMKDWKIVAIGFGDENIAVRPWNISMVLLMFFRSEWGQRWDNYRRTPSFRKMPFLVLDFVNLLRRADHHMLWLSKLQLCSRYSSYVALGHSCIARLKLHLELIIHDKTIFLLLLLNIIASFLEKV